MKIRTDFVTNSSSYSSAEVIIDNPVLLEILQKYKDLGTFDPDYSDFSIGDYKMEDDDHYEPPYMKSVENPALFVSKPEDSCWGYPPSSLEEVVDCIIESLGCGEAIAKEELFEQMQSELEDRSVELEAAYKFVVWGSGGASNELHESKYYDGYIVEDYVFNFDPAKGEEYHYILKAGPGSDTKVKEGFTFAEKHIINGEVKADFDLWSEFETEVEESEDDNDFHEDNE